MSCQICSMDLFCSWTVNLVPRVVDAVLYSCHPVVIVWSVAFGLERDGPVIGNKL